jgi:hypothetical protein
LIASAVPWEKLDAARRELAKLELNLNEARARFSGAHWIAAWMDWDARWKRCA